MKQTAVEWFFENLNSHKIEANANELFKQALEMEKQQIIEAHGLIAKLQEDGTHKLISGETYYNETYKPSA
jgi:hypothetical protein